MTSLKNIKMYLLNPYRLFIRLGANSFLKWLNDEQYIQLLFRACMGKYANLENPTSYNEKLQWLKLNNRNPLYSKWADKYEAKILAAEAIGAKFINPSLGVWDKFDDINFDVFPNQFVLKCTHDCGGLVICRNKTQFDPKTAREKINKCLKRNYYWGTREYPYKDIKPRIIAEPYLEDSKTGDLRDYKFFAFDGTVKAMFIATDRGSKEETKFDFFDADFNHLPFMNGHPNAPITPEKPSCFEEMKRLASILSRGIPHVRVDFYEANGRVFFGEMTFFHWGGVVPFNPEKWDYIFGSWIKLPTDNVCLEDKTY